MYEGDEVVEVDGFETVDLLVRLRMRICKEFRPGHASPTRWPLRQQVYHLTSQLYLHRESAWNTLMWVLRCPSPRHVLNFVRVEQEMSEIFGPIGT
jgi:hypothetical protein